MAMKNQMIAVTEQQMDFLNDKSIETGVPKSELIRRMIDWYRVTYPLTAVVNVKEGSDE